MCAFRFNYELIVSEEVARAISFYEMNVTEICTMAILDALKQRIEVSSAAGSIRKPQITGVSSRAEGMGSQKQGGFTGTCRPKSCVT